MIQKLNTIAAMADVGIMEKIQEFFSTLKTAFDSFGSIGSYLLAIIVFLVGRAVCRVIRGIVYKSLGKTGIDEKLGKLVGHQGAAEGAISTFVYYILLLYLVILSLGIAKLDKVSGPLQDMLSEFLNYIPNIVGAGLLLFFVLLVAKIIKNLVSGLMEAAKLDEKLGAAAGKAPVAGALATALYCFIVLMFTPDVLDALGIESLSKPISEVVQSILSAVPNIITASVLVAIGILIGQIARQLVTSLLQAAGADLWPAKLGFDVPQEGKNSLSGVVGLIVMLSVAVLMIGTAINVLDLDLLAGASEIFVVGYFNVLLAVLVFGAGILLAKFAYKGIADKSVVLAKVAKYAILVLTTVVALDRSGLASDLTGLPYMVAIYAVGVAFGVGGAIAIGLGGRDYVARQLEKRG